MERLRIFKKGFLEIYNIPVGLSGLKVGDMLLATGSMGAFFGAAVSYPENGILAVILGILMYSSLLKALLS